jgi:hypothetical protein
MTRFHPSFTCLLFHATSFERQDCTPEVPVRLLRYPLGQLGRQVEAFSLANDLQGTAQKNIQESLVGTELHFREN